MSTLLTILGPGASGKSTLTRGLLGEGAYEFRVLVNGTAVKAAASAGGAVCLAGNLKNGSDAISQMEDLAAVLRHWVKMPETRVAITDGVRCSAKWNVDWARRESGYERLVYVYLDVSEAEVCRRLIKRRTGNGMSAEITEATLSNVRSFIKRARNVWRAAEDAKSHNADGRMLMLRVNDERLAPEGVLALVREKLALP